MSFSELFRRIVSGGQEREQDWVPVLKEYSAFQDCSEDTIVEMASRFVPISDCKSGDVIIKQGEEADAFYLVGSGTVKVLREPEEEGGSPEELAVLHEGQGFGEEALISNAKRNATVVMDTPGVLLKLYKEDFNELLKESQIQWMSRVQAQKAIKNGAQWVDVRDVTAYENGTLPGAISLPLKEIREKSERLEKDKTYICFCEHGRNSATAVYLLQQLGFNNVYVLRGGLTRLKGKGKGNSSE